MAAQVMPWGLTRLYAVVSEKRGRSSGSFPLLDDQARVQIQRPVEFEHQDLVRGANSRAPAPFRGIIVIVHHPDSRWVKYGDPPRWSRTGR
jgi:hypothetical protein